MGNAHAPDRSKMGGLNGAPLDLAGTWVPARHSEWYNNNPGKHKHRARAAHTRIVYDPSGLGLGNVGEVRNFAGSSITSLCLVPLLTPNASSLSKLKSARLPLDSTLLLLAFLMVGAWAGSPMTEIIPFCQMERCIFLSP